MARKAGRVARVMNGFVDQIDIEGGGALNQREEKSLVERHDVEREETEQRESRENPFLAACSNRRFHSALRLSASFYVLFNFNAIFLQARFLNA
jgi:hypothetical protein